MFDQPIGEVAKGTSNHVRVFVHSRQHVILLDDEDEPIFLTSAQAATLAALLRTAADKCDE